MPVCDHTRQYLTALASEDDLIFTGRTVYFPKSVFQISISLFPLTSFIPSFSAASDLCLQFAKAYQLRLYF